MRTEIGTKALLAEAAGCENEIAAIKTEIARRTNRDRAA
jgi:hypothetical protein